MIRIIIIIIYLVGSYLCFFSDLCNLLCLFMCVSLTGFADDVHISHSINRIITEVHTVLKSEINEPRCEKTGLRGFRSGPTQTGLYSHRRWLEA